MKQFAKLTTCALTLGMGVGFWSCSNEEPVSGGNIDFEAGETAYLNITLRDANDLATRAGEEEGDPSTPTLPGSGNGGFEYGSNNEGTVNMARFYFFDDKGIYVGQSNIWKDTNTSDGEDKNIEFKSESLVVLDNLKGNKYPKYMVTVLNGKPFTNEQLNNVSLDDFSKLPINWGENKEFGFIMVTSSYFSDKTQTNHDDTYPFATVLTEANFSRTPEEAKNQTAVNVYVERVASRVRLKSNEFFPILATVAGAEGDNPEAGTNDNEAATKLTVRIDGWYVNGTEAKSYLAKQLSGWNSTSNIQSTASGYWNWNIADLHRSFWGKSINYDNKQSEEKLQFFPYTTTSKGLTNENYANVDYFNENTSTKTALDNNGRPNQQRLTSVILKATVGQVIGESFKELEIVEHNGLYFTTDRFLNYVLASVGSGKIPYIRTSASAENGTVTYTYTQLTVDDFMVNGTDNNSDVFVTVKSEVSTELYYYDVENDKEGDAVTHAQLNSDLAAVTSGVRTRLFKDGSMYYNIPIAHLNSPTYDSTGDLDNWEEGSFGVVRNHSYEININNVKKLGNGVFDPNDEKTSIKPDPDPKDPNWYLGATINILSWKIVTNNVDL